MTDQNKMQIIRTDKRRAGQGMTEYIIMVALIAIAAIGVYGLFGETLRNQVGGMAQSLAGETNTGTAAAAASANNAADTAQESVGLGDYSGGDSN